MRTKEYYWNVSDRKTARASQFLIDHILNRRTGKALLIAQYLRAKHGWWSNRDYDWRSGRIIR